MNNVNRTLYIPLYGKSYVSRRGILLTDPMAEELWDEEGFPLKGKSASKWLAYYMAMRAVVFDRWTLEKMAQHPDAVVLHLGCGLDSRVIRTGVRENLWLDVDFPDVIEERQEYYQETGNYRMVGCDLREDGWLKDIPGEKAIVIMEGISMYLKPEELKILHSRLKEHFSHVYLLMDCYSSLAAKASKWKNPINDVGVFEVFGMDDPQQVGVLTFLGEWAMTPEDLIEELPKKDQRLFRKLYAGSFARKLYRLYEYEG
jgi:O-methyltransferase involved in polyketide biosynthesis